MKFRPVWPAVLLLPLLVLMLGVLSPPAAHAQPPHYPPDLRIVADAGGIPADFPVRRVAIDSSGTGEYCLILPADRATATCSSVESLTFTVAQLNAIWDAASLGGFFALPPLLLDPTLADGSVARLTITAGGITREVVTQNIAVPAFDSVMLAINGALPSGRRLKYNAIAP